jgi:hypothetical protein
MKKTIVLEIDDRELSILIDAMTLKFNQFDPTEYHKDYVRVERILKELKGGTK